MKSRYKSLFIPLLLLQPLTVNANEYQTLNNDEITIVAKNDILSLPASSQDIPMGQGDSGKTVSLLPEDDATTSSDNDLFGIPGGGYVHPYLSIGGEYTDNLFNVKDNETSNFLTRISPGIWLAIPRTKDVPIAISPNNTSPGGLQMALPDSKSFDRINAYLLGGLDYKFYSEDSDLNDHDARLEGSFKFNLRSGLSFQVADSFTRNHDRFDIGNATADNLRLFNSNLALAAIDWDITEKFRSKIEYSNFDLDYKDAVEDFLDRNDDSFSWYGFYNYSVKTALFLQYQYIDVSYDIAELKDNKQNYIYGGINWKSTQKTSLHFKAGYQKRKYKDDAVEIANTGDNDALALELALLYQITQKTGVALSLNHKIEESDSFTALDKKIFAATFRYHQELTERLLGLCDFSYENADYSQTVGLERDDDRYVFRPALQYTFRDWLMGEVAYQYDTRSSTDDFYDYNSNTISFSINTAL